MLRQASLILPIRAAGPGLTEFTVSIRDFVRESGISTGLLTLFCRHTSASLLIQENAAGAVRRDLEAFFARIAPESDAYEHDDEGPDDMPAHLRTALTQTHLAIPVQGGKLLLGRWQGVYLFEHRRRASTREIALHLVGE
jgi:secondary thiamine-phosphate synthase enzyme